MAWLQALVCHILFVLSVCALGHGQELTLFKILPCSPVRMETVSRFKSDVYAVESNLTMCPESTLQDFAKAAEDHGYSSESVKIVSVCLKVVWSADCKLIITTPLVITSTKLVQCVYVCYSFFPDSSHPFLLALTAPLIHHGNDLSACTL